MNIEQFEKELIQLQAQVHRLAEEELDGIGDKYERHLFAIQLNEKFLSLQSQNIFPELALKSLYLDDRWRSIEHDLNFLMFVAGQANDFSDDQNVDILLRELSRESFNLAQSVFNKSISLAEAKELASELDRRLKDTANLPGRDTLHIQRVLSEANLDLNYIFAGGKGPTSIRLHQFMSDMANR